ncbi:MAG: hypothetical protein J7J54_00435 [Candidatus Omnitrophica bacterium]|nr:hypothetical protein [Candidatus Omnitrophota bacterium]
MENKGLFKIESKKSIPEFIESFKENAPKFNFGVRYVFDMKKEYKEHNVDVDENFELYQIILCNFERSYKTMKRNIETAPVLLQPKQVVVYNNKGVTTIYYLPFTKEFIAQALPDDEKLQESLPNSCQKIIRLIEASI